MNDKKNLTIKDVARICGVGIGTVSRTINNQPGVRDEIRRKILGHINDLGWRRSGIVDRFGNANNGKLIVIVASRGGVFSRYNDNDLVDLLLEQCEQQHYETMLLLTNRTEALRQCACLKPHAVIQVGRVDTMDEPELKLQNQGVRLINLAETESFNGAMLHPDHFAAGREMARALRRAGHRRIGFLGGLGSLSHPTSDQLPSLRLQKLLTGISAEHPEFELSRDSVSDNYGDGAQLLEALKQNIHTAWICDEQRSCALFFHIAASLEIKIPHDLSLVTISPETPFYLYPLDVSRSYCNLTERSRKVMELINAETFPEHEEYTFPNGFHRGATIQKIKGTNK